jgi:hypothetical protein
MSLESSAGLLGPSQPCWPRRRFARLEAGPPTTDDLGFVIPSDSDVTCLELLEYRVVLVVAPPWTGKSWVALAIERACSGEGRPFGERTSLENLGPTSSVLPGWWEKWKNSEDQALWLVDSVDEDDRARSHRVKDLLMEVERLPEVCRARLTLWFFCRENEVPDYFLGRLEEVCGQVARFRLLPLDSVSASELVPSGTFEGVCELIRRNRLKSISAFPMVLEVLCGYPSDASLSAAKVWRSVLVRLLTRKEREAPRIDDLFSMACQLAIVASFCGPVALAELSSAQDPAPSFDQLIPEDDPKVSQLTLAAQEALKSAVFVSSTGLVRFAQDHTREWLAAFGMQSWQLGRVRPMVTLADGKLNARHRGLLGILWQVTTEQGVKDWIVAASGGIVPASDAAPWSLEQATLALDRLTELARQSGWGLAFWGERDRLEHFRVPGMAPELVGRLEAETDPLGQRLLLRVAEVIGARACSRRAFEIASDPKVQEGLGDVAMGFLDACGDDVTIAALQDWIETEFLKGRETPHLSRILRRGVWILLKRDLWGWFRAARALLLWPCKTLDFLEIYIDNPGPALDQAREFVTWAAGELASGRHQLLHGELRFGMRKALELALSRIADQPDFSETDAQLLVLLAESPAHGQDEGNYLVRQAIHSLEGPRRAYFCAVLDHRPGKRLPGLCSEDLDWLRQEIERRDGEPKILWGHFYALFQFGKTDALSREEARRYMGEREPELLSELDQDTAKAEEHSLEFRNRVALATEPTLKLADLVEQALREEGWSLENRFQRLARLCFARVLRPSGVKGTWLELPRELQVHTVQLCHRALQELEPTMRTDPSIPNRMIFDRECIQFLVDNGLLDLTPGLIEKWLPTVLSIPDSRESGVVRKAFETHREAAEAALLQWLELSLRIDPDSYRTAPVPDEFWSAELAGRILDLAEGPNVGLEAKVPLHWQCATRQKERVLQAARSWCAQSESADLRRHGVDLLMVHSPKEGLPHLLSLPAIEESLGRTRWIDSSPGNIVAGLDWSERSDLFDFLWRVCPAKPGDSEEGFGAIGAAEWGSQVIRSEILERFSEAILEPEARAAVDHLATRISWVGKWRDKRLANVEAAWLLHRQNDPATGEPWLQVSEVLPVIHSDHRRILRSVSDLHSLIVEEIRAIGADSNRHLPMLYHPLKDGKRKRLHEEALQAYLECRLLDRLEPRLGQRPTIHINREPLAARNERNDLKVEAAAHNGDKLTVVIEVKWSDNQGVWAALVDQLGQRYLRDQGLTHGIYLVGDCGKWSSKDRPAGGIPDSVEGGFRSQTSQFQGLLIEPIVLDLQWTRP